MGLGSRRLLRIVAGVMSATKGEVQLELNGEISETSRPAVSQPGYVAPYFSVYEGMTARENLAFIGKVRRLKGASESGR